MPAAARAAAAASQAISAVKRLSIIATMREVNIIEQYNHPCSRAKTPCAKRFPFSVIKAKTSLKEIAVWGGKSNQVSLGVAENIILTLPRPTFKDLKISYEYSNNLKAPIQDGEVLGSLIIKDGDSVVHAAELIALDSVDAKGFFGRLWASFILWIRNLFSF